MSPQVVWRHLTITSARREAPNWHKSAILRFTGLSGAGKPAIAHATEEALHRLDRRTFAFDADSVRHGVCADLGFPIEDRRENIRRIGEMRKLFLEASASAPTALISPFLAVRGADLPETDVRHEPDSVQRIEGVPLLADIAQTDQHRRAIVEFVDKLPDARLTKVTTTLPVFQKSYYSHPQFLLRRFGILATKLASRVFGELPVPEVVDYRKVKQLAIVWKSIESTGRLGVLCRSLPECRAVLILRHPCGYAASVLRGEAGHKFTSRTPSHEDYGLYALLLDTRQARERGLTMDALKRMRPIERLAWRWVLFYEYALDAVAGLPNCSHVCYEDVCRDPLAQSQRLFEFSGLSWNEQTETFVRQSTASENSAYYSIFKDPLTSANKWKDELPADDIERVLAVVKDSAPGRLYTGRD